MTDRVEMLGISDLVDLAFHRARRSYNTIHDRWIKLSFRLGGRLPKSTLVSDFQRIGDIDVLLRCMESEIRQKIENNEIQLLSNINFFSEIWVRLSYETIRTLREINCAYENKLADAFQMLENVRMPLDKHQINKDRFLKKASERSIELETEGDPSKISVYSIDDKKRSIIMPRAISMETGSMRWATIEISGKTEVWVERVIVSDLILSLLDEGPD